MEYRKIAIVGLGAVGSYFYWGLSECEDIQLMIIAEGDRKARLERDGLIINGRKYQPSVYTPAEAKGADLLIVALKYNALSAALADFRDIVDEHTVILCPMNGVDCEDIIAGEVGMEHMVHSVIKIASERVGNSIAFDPETTIGLVYGEMDKDKSPERVTALKELFDRAHIKNRITDVIESEIWSKFLLNVGSNLIQAIVGCGVGAYTDSKYMAYMKEKLREEVKAIAAAKGVDMGLSDKSSANGAKAAPRGRYSTLQDLDAKRHTEVDIFSGAIVRMGKELGVATPYNDMAYNLIKAIEEKNDGKFDYQ